MRHDNNENATQTLATDQPDVSGALPTSQAAPAANPATAPRVAAEPHARALAAAVDDAADVLGTSTRAASDRGRCARRAAQIRTATRDLGRALRGLEGIDDSSDVGRLSPQLRAVGRGLARALDDLAAKCGAAEPSGAVAGNAAPPAK